MTDYRIDQRVERTLKWGRTLHAAAELKRLAEALGPMPKGFPFERLTVEDDDTQGGLLKLVPSSISSYHGVRCLEPVKNKTTVSDYHGYLFTRSEFDKLPIRFDTGVDLDVYSPDESKLYKMVLVGIQTEIGPSFMTPIEEAGNCILDRNEEMILKDETGEPVLSPNGKWYIRSDAVCIKTSRDIKGGEELLVPYDASPEKVLQFLAQNPSSCDVCLKTVEPTERTRCKQKDCTGLVHSHEYKSEEPYECLRHRSMHQIQGTCQVCRKSTDTHLMFACALCPDGFVHERCLVKKLEHSEHVDRFWICTAHESGPAADIHAHVMNHKWQESRSRLPHLDDLVYANVGGWNKRMTRNNFLFWQLRQLARMSDLRPLGYWRGAEDSIVICYGRGSRPDVALSVMKDLFSLDRTCFCTNDALHPRSANLDKLDRIILTAFLIFQHRKANAVVMNLHIVPSDREYLRAALYYVTPHIRFVATQAQVTFYPKDSRWGMLPKVVPVVVPATWEETLDADVRVFLGPRVPLRSYWEPEEEDEDEAMEVLEAPRETARYKRAALAAAAPVLSAEEAASHKKLVDLIYFARATNFRIRRKDTSGFRIQLKSRLFQKDIDWLLKYQASDMPRKEFNRGSAFFSLVHSVPSLLWVGRTTESTPEASNSTFSLPEDLYAYVAHWIASSGTHAAAAIAAAKR